jgi:hypothetical protein
MSPWGCAASGHSTRTAIGGCRKSFLVGLSPPHHWQSTSTASSRGCISTHTLLGCGASAAERLHVQSAVDCPAMPEVGGAQPDANPRFRHPKRRMRFRLLKLHCSSRPPFLHARSSPGKIAIAELHAHHAILTTFRGQSQIPCPAPPIPLRGR